MYGYGLLQLIFLPLFFIHLTQCMKHRLFAIATLLFTATIIWAQSPSAIDSLLRILQTGNDTTRVNIFVALCKEYRPQDPDKSLHYGNEALSLARKLDFYSGATFGNALTGSKEVSSASLEQNQPNL
jgi:hypothetical protein